MKSIYKLSLLACLGGLSLTTQAQTSYNAGLLMENQLNGTARFMGMGGAMSALGADLSTLATNPAGIGLYRSNDVAFSLGWFQPTAKAEFNGESTDTKHSKFSFDQIGFVYSSKVGNRTAIRFLNFGFNYRKVKNFNSDFDMIGPMPSGDSYSHNIRANLQAAGNTPEDFDNVLNSNNPLADTNYSWLSILAGETGYVSPGLDNKDFDTWGADYIGFHSENRGGINAYDFNLALNIKDRVYLGVTLGVYDLDFDRYSYYYERLFSDKLPDESPLMTLENQYSLEGSGFDIKLGLIFRPMEYSPLRIGLAVHTPIWYNLSQCYAAAMGMQDYQGQDWNSSTGFTDWYDYSLRAPWKFNLSAAYTFGQNVALDAEYEYADYSKAKFTDPNGYDLDYSNQLVSEDLKGVHSFRIGVEGRIFDDISLRAGYGYTSALYKELAYKYDAPTAIETDIDYMNNYDAHSLSLGLGLRFGGFYADMAYVYTHQKADFYPYSNMIFEQADPLTKVTHADNRAVFTLGYRF